MIIITLVNNICSSKYQKRSECVLVGQKKDGVLYVFYVAIPKKFNLNYKLELMFTNETEDGTDGEVIKSVNLDGYL